MQRNFPSTHLLAKEVEVTLPVVVTGEWWAWHVAFETAGQDSRQGNKHLTPQNGE